MPSSSPYLSSATHRRTQPQDNDDSSAALNYRAAVAPAPKPLALFRVISFGLIVLLGILQFLPATHFRHPSDPHRNWFPIDANASSHSASLGRASDQESADRTTLNYQEDGMVHIVSWMECLDLRLLTVLANSTLSSSRIPDLIYFHFFIPGGSEDKLQFYKLKVLFPNSNIEIHGQEKVKDLISSALFPLRPNYKELAPLAIPSILQSLTKFIYLSPDLIVKGKVEDLISLDLQNHGIAAVEDCSRRLSTYVNPDLLDAVQRSASRPWVSNIEYEKNACILDTRVILIDARKLGNDFLQAVSWWTTVLNWNERTAERNPALFLALYNKYMKLQSSWSAADVAQTNGTNEKMAISYDGPKNLCLLPGAKATEQPKSGDLWKQYLPSISSLILGS